jgi:hypothetical protein
MSNRKPISKRKRFSIFARDNFTCVYCGMQPPLIVLHLEHVIPIVEGGTDDESNLRAACADCNLGKGPKKIEDTFPTEHDRLARAQELGEAREAAEKLNELMDARDELRQSVTNAICKARGTEEVLGSIVSSVCFLINEFDVETVYRWIVSAAARPRSETDFIKYLHGIARRTREQDEVCV